MRRTVLEICAGAGGQACGLERAGFDHQAAVDIEDACTDTLRLNRPRWNVVTSDIREVDGRDYRGVDLLAGGVPCSPFSIAGKQLGADDERDLFPETVRIIREARPTAIMLENVPAFASARFDGYRVSMLLKPRDRARPRYRRRTQQPPGPGAGRADRCPDRLRPGQHLRPAARPPAARPGRGGLSSHLR